MRTRTTLDRETDRRDDDGMKLRKRRPGDSHPSGSGASCADIEQGTPGVVDERSFFGFGTTYEVAFDVGDRVDRRDGLDDHDIAPV
jgi:hypothetical protein